MQRFAQHHQRNLQVGQQLAGPGTGRNEQLPRGIALAVGLNLDAV